MGLLACSDLTSKCLKGSDMCVRAVGGMFEGNEIVERRELSFGEFRGARSRLCIFIVNGRSRERVTHVVCRRSREPSRICLKVKRIMEKRKKIRRMYETKGIGSVPRSSKLYQFSKSKPKYFLTSSRRIVECKSEVCMPHSIKRRSKKHKKDRIDVENKQVVDDWSKIFKSAIHERLYKKILLFNDVETNPGPFYVDSCKTVKGSFHQGDEELFGINA